MASMTRIEPLKTWAAMEPGLGDREWQPAHGVRLPDALAAMEPGLGDREWVYRPLPVSPCDRQAAMEPGLGDREW